MTSIFLSRRATAVYLLAGAIFTAVSFAVTPWEDEQTTRAYLDAMEAHPTQAELSAFLLYFGYLFLAVGAFGILSVLGRSGGWAMRIGGVLTVIGGVSMPGLVVTDAYDLAIARELPRDVGVRLSDVAGETPLASVILILALIGFILGGVLLVVALWRAGEVPVAAPILALLAWAVPMAGLNLALMLAGAALLLAAYGIVAVRLWRPQAEAVEGGSSDDDRGTHDLPYSAGDVREGSAAQPVA